MANCLHCGYKNDMEEAVKKHMGLKVKVMRERAKLTQEQLAEECGVSWRTISNLERGLVVPDLTMLRSIAQKFNVFHKMIINNYLISYRRYIKWV